MTIRRVAVNPWTWSLEFGFNQGEVVEGERRTLYCAGQTAMSADGQPQHAGDMGAQVAMAVDNLEAVLGEAGMSLANVVRLNIYTTDVDELLANYGSVAERLQSAGVAPPGTLLGVARLAFPELLVEIEATAVDSNWRDPLRRLPPVRDHLRGAHSGAGLEEHLHAVVARWRWPVRRFSVFASGPR